MDLFGADTGTASMVLVLLILNLIKGETILAELAGICVGCKVCFPHLTFDRRNSSRGTLMSCPLLRSVLHTLRLLRLPLHIVHLAVESM